MRKIELLGPSGSGKTTVFSEILNCSGNRDWKTVEQFLQTIQHRIGKAVPSFQLQQLESTVVDISLPAYENLIALSLEGLRRTTRPIIQAQMTRFYLDKVIWDAAAVDFFGCQDDLVYPDGILHNNTGIGVQDIDKSSRIAAVRASGVSSVIRLCISAEENFQRRKKKILSSQGTFVDRLMNDKELFESCVESINRSQIKADLLREAGIEVTDVEVTGRSVGEIAEEVSQIISRDFTTHPKALSFLTFGDLVLLSLENPNSHWQTQPLEKRWEYHQKTIELVKKIGVSSPEEVLEMGTMGAQIVKNSCTIDYSENWEFKGKNPDYMHDARITPWPIETRKFKLFIALRVFQHITPSQKEAFQEAKRIAKHVIISVPETYSVAIKELENSKGIRKEEFIAWNNGIEPDLEIPTKMGTLYYWNFDQ